MEAWVNHVLHYLEVDPAAFEHLLLLLEAVEHFCFLAHLSDQEV